jgi:hypothetical protein
MDLDPYGIKEFKYSNLKKLFLSSRKYDPGCSSRILDPDFFPIPDPGFGSRAQKAQKSTGSRMSNTGDYHPVPGTILVRTGTIGAYTESTVLI